MGRLSVAGYGRMVDLPREILDEYPVCVDERMGILNLIYK